MKEQIRKVIFTYLDTIKEEPISEDDMGLVDLLTIFQKENRIPDQVVVECVNEIILEKSLNQDQEHFLLTTVWFLSVYPNKKF